VNTGRPHIELLAQRIFDALKEELDGPELTLAADELVRAQQHCWRLVCDHMEEKITESLKSKRDLTSTHERRAVSYLEGSLRQLSEELEEALEKHDRLDESASPRSDLPLLPSRRSTMRRPAPQPFRRRRWKLCPRCWCPCYAGLWKRSRR